MQSLTPTRAKTLRAQSLIVCVNHDPVIITKKGTDAVVMISLEDFEAMQETTHLLRSPRNAKRLIESIEQLNAGSGRERELVE